MPEEMMMESVEAPEVEVIETDTQETSTEGQPEQQQTETSEDPYSPKSSSEYAKWLKGIRDSDPANAKFARMAKDDHARLYQLQQMEPRGIDGMREKYALLDSVQHGEFKGVEALAAMQDELRSVTEIDERLFNGDHTALTEMGEEFVQQALPKLAGPILDMVRQSNPEAYNAAVLPHFVEALKSSELVSNFNGLVDVLNEQMPSWLPEDKKQAWQADKMQRVMGLAGNMGGWFNAQQQKAGQLKPVDPAKANGKGTLDQERQTFHKEQQEHHWTTNINPRMDQHAANKFKEMFTPYDKRLKLDTTAKNGLMNEFSKRVASKAAANPAYMSQITRYHGQKNPDPGAVVNYAKVEFDKYAKNVMESLIKERYQPFLNGKQGSTPTNTGNTQKNGQNRGPIAPGVQIVAVKPAMQDIDHKGTPLDWLHQKKYRLTNGKVVQVRQ